jgi:hypothetical protein
MNPEEKEHVESKRLAEQSFDEAAASSGVPTAAFAA